jgi:hypothetical protein
MSAEAYLNRPRTRVRRKDRRLDDQEWQDRLLAMAPVAQVAIEWQGQPMITSNIFWHADHAIYMHAANVGKLRAIMDQGPRPACLTVVEMGRILPASTPFDFSTEYASVVIYGTLSVLSDAAQKRHALEGLMQKYAPQLTPGVDYVPMPDTDIALTSVFCFAIDEIVGKHNVKPLDAPAYAFAGGSFIDAERQAGRATVKAKDLA